MKTLKSLSLVVISMMVFTAATKAGTPEKVESGTTMKILTPVYKTLHDCEITYYIIRINDENVLMDNKGKVIKYLCEDDNLKVPQSYEVLTIPASLISR